MRTIENVGKIALLKAVGDPKEVLTASGNRLVLGVVRGFADKEVTRTIPTGETYKGYAGFFELDPAKLDRPVLRGSQCFFPPAFHSVIADALSRARKENKDARIDFAVEIVSKKSDGALGYSWEYVPQIMTATADPLAHLRPQPVASEPEKVKSKK